MKYAEDLSNSLTVFLCNNLCSLLLLNAVWQARKFGVRSAMPGFIAKQLCPDLIIVPSRMEAYKQASQQTREIFAQFDPDFEPLSLDEASLCITGSIL